MRLIDANELLKEMGAGCMPILEKGISQVTGDESTIKDYIDQAPTIEAESVRHGRWEPQWEHDFISGEEIVTGFCCSLCDYYYIKKHNYCPHCGVKMDLEV